MSSSQAQEVVVEPETPSSPQTLLVDALLVGLEIVLVKWLIKKWQEYEGGQGPPVARCQEIKSPPTLHLSASVNIFLIEYSTYETIFSRAVTKGLNYATFRLQALKNPGFEEWWGWNWHVEVIAKGSSIGATDGSRCWLWNTECPFKRFKSWTDPGTGMQCSGDPDDENMTGAVCGCVGGDNCDPSSCDVGGVSNGHWIGVFYQFYEKFKSENASISDTCPCPGLCGSGSGGKKPYCTTIKCS
jgi:hypothetical protein